MFAPRSLKASPRQTQMEVAFAGEELVLDACGALFFPAHDLLVVSDLHLEKGSFFAARGNPIPCLDTHDTLKRLAAAVECYGPHTLVCLGDSFHDLRAAERMNTAAAALLQQLIASVKEWIWITGNHDQEAPSHFAGRAAASLVVGQVTLRHQPGDGDAPLIAGHYHPKHVLRLAEQYIAARCFALGPDLLLMPAFGAYAGGLRTYDEAICALFGTQPRRHILIYGDKLWAID